MWIPVQSLRWLGFHWDFARGLLSIPEDKISVLLASISEVSSSRIVTARLLAQVTGRIISCMLVFDHICKIMTKALHSVIDSRAYWNSRVFLTTEAISELIYWRANALNSRPLVSPVKYILFDGLTYNTRRYFASCVVFFRAPEGRGKMRAMSKMSRSN